jgi:alginate O-acetyltransferase complex protein AlgI
MLFNSTVFLLLFLPVTYAVFWLLPTNNSRFGWLTIASYMFYGYWNPSYCVLMAFATVISYVAGLAFRRTDGNGPARRVILITTLCIELALLGYFKYASFSITVVNTALASAGIHHTLPLVNVLLPIGISFYIFHTISYVIDCYIEVVEPTRNPLEFACYVSLFSQLVAGPIVRFWELKKDLEQISTANRRSLMPRAWSFFAIGLAQKVVLADTISSIIDPALKDVSQLSTLSAWLCMLGYTYQLYFDFAGYSNMAVGLGLLFGVHIPQNFNSPYTALNPADFWRRWHMTLSRWFRDYLFVPLVGRGSEKYRIYSATLGTMTLCGLWHGANVTFMIWGAYHGLLLVLYDRSAATWDRVPKRVQRVGTFLLVLLGLTMFRAPNYRYALVLLDRMFRFHSGLPPIALPSLVFFLCIAAGIAHWAPNTFELKHEWSSPILAVITVLFVVSLFLIYAFRNSPFLYFQF